MLNDNDKLLFQLKDIDGYDMGLLQVYGDNIEDFPDDFADKYSKIYTSDDWECIDDLFGLLIDHLISIGYGGKRIYLEELYPYCHRM